MAHRPTSLVVCVTDLKEKSDVDTPAVSRDRAYCELHAVVAWLSNCILGFGVCLPHCLSSGPMIPPPAPPSAVPYCSAFEQSSVLSLVTLAVNTSQDFLVLSVF